MRGRRRAAIAAAAAALVAACAHRPPPVLHSAQLVVQRSSGGVRPFVRARVAGKPVMLLVDTGAVQSILPAAFVREQKVPWHSSAGDRDIVDGNGRLATMPVLRDVPVQFEGESSAGTIDFLMNPAAGFDDLLLAPQDLVRPGWALVIDLDHAELGLEPEDGALKRVAGRGTPLRKVDFHRCLDEGFFSRSHRIVSARINGVAAEMLIDTGAEITVLARHNPALPSMISMLGRQGSSVGVASTGRGLQIDDVPIVFSKTSFVLPTVVLPASNTCAHGVLGADLLSHCTLVWGWSSLWAACRAPGPGR